MWGQCPGGPQSKHEGQHELKAQFCLPMMLRSHQHPGPVCSSHNLHAQQSAESWQAIQGWRLLGVWKCKSPVTAPYLGSASHPCVCCSLAEELLSASRQVEASVQQEQALHRMERLYHQVSLSHGFDLCDPAGHWCGCKEVYLA